jgi:gliding motility-associated-like protein
VNVGTGSDCISTVTIQYRSANTTYNNPKQYVVVSNLRATIVNATPPTSITGPSAICNGGSITLNSTGTNASSQWYSGSCGGTLVGTGTSITVSPAVSTTYFVSNVGLCNSQSTCISHLVNISSNPTSPSIGTTTQPTCSTPTGSVALSGLPVGSWTITASPGGATLNGSGSSASFSGLSPSSNYSFTVTNSDGCTSGSSLAASILSAPVPPSSPVIDAVTQPTCTSNTGSVNISGLPAGNWTVTATPGGNTQLGSGTSTAFSGLNPGSYTFTVTNASGCTSSSSSNVTINAVPGLPSAPVAGTITQPSCTLSTGSIQLNGLPSGAWVLNMNPGSVSTNGSGTSTTVSGLSSGTYNFTVTNDLGCTSVNSANVVMNPQPNIPVEPLVGSITQPTCTIPTGTVNLSGLPSGSWTLTASPGGVTQNGTGSTTQYAGLSANTTYSFTVTNDDGCTSVNSVSAAINPAPITPSAPLIGTISQPTCNLPTGSVDFTGLPVGIWTLTVSPGGANTSGSGSTTTFSGLNPGNYTFTVSDGSGCESPSSSLLTINSAPGAPALPIAGILSQPTCAIGTGSIEISDPLGSQYSYSIDGTTFQSSTLFTGLLPGSYTITVTDQNSGCSSNSSGAITIDPVSDAPVVTLISSSSVTCFGDADGTLEINISGGQSPYTVAWDPNVGNSTIVSGLVSGNYEVEVTDDNGCTTTEEFSVGSPAELQLNGASSNVICGTTQGSIVTTANGGTGAYTYSWMPNGETSSSLSSLIPGVYSVEVIDENDCIVGQSFTITSVGSLPVDIAPESVEISPGQSAVLTASGGVDYTWTPSLGLSCTACPDPTATPSGTTVYYVSATDENGCSGIDSSIVVVKLPCGELFVPTIFSPNGTGPDNNDRLCVFGTKSCIEELKFEVYDRWGELVFETTDQSVCWDGNFRDKPMNSGIFVYRLYVKFYNIDEPVDISGNTTLVR